MMSTQININSENEFYENENIVTIDGIVGGIIFQNAENGYCVFTLEPDNFDDEKSKDVEKTDKSNSDDDEIVCVGYIPSLSEGESIHITGSFVIHPAYGRQLKIDLYEKTIPKTERGIEKYLASGVIKGIGKKIANKIVSKFGTQTLNIMENEPEKLSAIRGISPEKALAIGEIFHEQAQLRRAMLFLQDYGISPIYSLKIYKRFKDNTIKTVTTNPYILADEISGIGFKISDLIAEKVGIEKNSPFRVKSGIKYILNHASLSGNVYLPFGDVIKETSALLELPDELIENGLIELNLSKQIRIEENTDDQKTAVNSDAFFEKNQSMAAETMVFLNSYHYAENYVAKKLVELSMIVSDDSSDYDKEIKELEKESGITLAENQKTAIKESMQNGVLVITGGPGTGKTTTINTIIKLLKKNGMEIELAAPTGRAAKRMSETTNMEAQTIHRLLGITYLSESGKRQTFDKDEENPIETDVIIIDESSMVDILLMYNLLKAIPHGTRLILVGDVDQLPSVGPGNVLKDTIASGVIKVVRLTEIFRQAQESAIVMNAHRINSGEYPVLNEKGKDFFFMKRYDVNTVCSTILELATTRLPAYMKCDKLKDIQLLTPMRKSQLGITNLNKLLQNALNPPNNLKEEKEFRNIIFREGDKVMQIKNNYNMVWRISDKNTNKQLEEGVGIFNGDEGIIQRINLESEYIDVLFDDIKTVRYDFTQLDELELSYAVTIHKSQGSEYKVVIIPVHSGPSMLMNRNLIYTAVTRAKELAVLVGIPETLYKMIDNNKEINRYTYLKSRIKQMYEIIKNG